MTVMLEFFAEQHSGLKICTQVFRDTESGKFKVMILPKGEDLWYAVSIRANRSNKIDLECLRYTFHFIPDEKGNYSFRNGKGPIPVGAVTTAHLHALLVNLREAERHLKGTKPAKK